MRFCVQAKDRFVVRLVKIADKKTVQTGASADGNQMAALGQLKFILQDPRQMQNLQTAILDAVKAQRTSLFVGFQAQFPAIGWENGHKSTSAEQINKSIDNLRIFRQQMRLGKGVRLTFSCPLMGNGLHISDFYSGKVLQRVS